MLTQKYTTTIKIGIKQNLNAINTMFPPSIVSSSIVASGIFENPIDNADKDVSTMSDVTLYVIPDRIRVKPSPTIKRYETASVFFIKFFILYYQKVFLGLHFPCLVPPEYESEYSP